MPRFLRQSFPLDALRNENFARIEPGVLRVVRWLFGIGAVPVWSCEGHRRDANRSVWFPKDIWQLVRGKPYVICAGCRRTTKRRKGGIYTAMRLLDEGFGPFRLFYLHVPDRRQGNHLLYRIRWVGRGRNYFAVVFADKLAAMPMSAQLRTLKRMLRRKADHRSSKEAGRG